MTQKSRVIGQVLAGVALACALQSGRSLAAEGQGEGKQSEAELIAVLKSEAPAAEKAITCKRLAVYGGKEAVPALAGLLTSPELSSWARIALEAIPDPSASQALRDALAKVQGRLLVGVINSLGVREDTGAVSALTAKLQDADPQVASAAAEALGRIGSQEAARALEAAMPGAGPEVRSAVAYGCVMAAEKLLGQGNSAAAVALYDRVRQSAVPKQRVLEATRGAILARGSSGLSLLMEQLRAQDMALFNIGVRTARELPGRDVTQAVATELDQAPAERQIPLLLALADRTDAAVLPKVLQVADTGAKPLRQTALGLLDRYRDLACVPVLLNGAADTDAELSRTAKSSLARLGGKDVDADLVARLRLATGRMRQVLIEMAGLRRLDGALPAVTRSTEDPDPGVRRAALETIGVLGNQEQAGPLVRLLSSTANSEDREDIERSLSQICRRSGARALPQILPLAQSGDTTLRKVGLRALSSIGGPEALAAVKAGMQDRDESVQDESVNLLSTWPNTWPEDSAVADTLLTLAKSGKKPAYKAQGLRGYLQYVEENKNLSTDDRLSKLLELLTTVSTPDEKRQVVGVIGSLPTARALDLLVKLVDDPAVSDEASLAAIKVATDRKIRDGSKQDRKAALQVVADKAKDPAVKKKATEELAKIK